MMAATHIVTTALVSSVPVLYFTNSNNLIFILFAIIGTLLPDRLEKIFLSKHRGFSHNILIYIFFMFISLLLKNSYGVFLFIGALLHLVFDSMSKNGIINALYPLVKKGHILFLMPKKYRYVVGSREEMIIFIVCSFALFMMYYWR